MRNAPRGVGGPRAAERRPGPSYSIFEWCSLSSTCTYTERLACRRLDWTLCSHERCLQIVRYFDLYSEFDSSPLAWLGRRLPLRSSSKLSAKRREETVRTSVVGCMTMSHPVFKKARTISASPWRGRRRFSAGGAYSALAALVCLSGVRFTVGVATRLAVSSRVYFAKICTPGQRAFRKPVAWPP